MPALPQLLIVAAGGAAGACARFALQPLPFDDSRRFCLTALVNLAGSFLIGLAWAMFDALGAPRWASLLAIAGVLGGFTTFSSFADDMYLMLQQRHGMSLGLYVGLSFLLGLAMVWLGRSLVKAS